MHKESSPKADWNIRRLVFVLNDVLNEILSDLRRKFVFENRFWGCELENGVFPRVSGDCVHVSMWVAWYSCWSVQKPTHSICDKFRKW